jgi:hypothetical protein
MLYLATYGIPTIAVCLFAGPFLTKAIVWLVTAFLIAALFLAIARLPGDPYLVFAGRKKDEFQSLGLTK